jgi:hypothetical protein
MVATCLEIAPNNPPFPSSQVLCLLHSALLLIPDKQITHCDVVTA